MTMGRNAALLIVAGLLAAEAALLSPAPDTTLEPTRLRRELPARIPGYRSSRMHFCQNETCMQMFTAVELDGAQVCPDCGGQLSNRSLAEHRQLPEDVQILRRRYEGSNGDHFDVTLLLSGHDRSSIHRAELCLVGQGHKIVKQRTVTVPLDEGRPLDVMVLDLLSGSRGPGSPRAHLAYWFEDSVHRTPHHAWRVFWIAWDSVVHGKSRRWAYVTVTSFNGPRSREDDIEHLRSFLAKLYPHLRRDRPQ